MIRLLLGLVVGVCAAGVAWAATQSGHWALIAGIVATVLVWFGEFILDDLI